MKHRVWLWMTQLRQKLWVRPLVYTLLAIAGVAAASAADSLTFADKVPRIDRETLEDLLAIIASSMMSVATLAVASMVAAYSSASSTATPRAFKLIVTDDVSKTALSGFIGAFIFSIVALTAIKTGFYGRIGLFVVFLLTILIFAIVIMLFLRWVDQIARLGRVGPTIERVEQAAAEALTARRKAPGMGGVPRSGRQPSGRQVHSDELGYVQSIDLEKIQRVAEEAGVTVFVEALPGTFIAPGRPLARIDGGTDEENEARREIARAFIIGDDRTFEEDPRFGLVTLAEIALRALSPAVNDPGTAIAVLGAFIRLLARWAEPCEPPEVRFDRVIVPELSTGDMFDDAFTAIARDGAGMVEVAIRLQKAFLALAASGDRALSAAAVEHSRLALDRSEQALKLPEDRARVRELAARVPLRAP